MPTWQGTQAVQEATTICPALCDLEFTRPFDLESGVCVTWATSVPILVFLGLSVLDFSPMYATDRRQKDRCQTDVRRQKASSFNAFAPLPPPRGRAHFDW